MKILVTFCLATLYFFVLYRSDVNRERKLVENYQYITSLTHAILVTIFSYIDLIIMMIYNLSLSDKTIISNWIYFSLFYFIYDTYWCIYLRSHMFIAHHICCIFVLVYTLMSDNYYILISIALFLGEATNPIFCTIKLFKEFGYKTKLLFIIFSVLFVSIRFIIVPLILLHILFNFSGTKKYVILLTGILLIAGSLFWAKGQYGYIKEKIAPKLD